MRLAELMAALSIATDFGMGQPLEFALPGRLGFLCRAVYLQQCDLSPWRKQPNVYPNVLKMQPDG